MNIINLSVKETLSTELLLLIRLDLAWSFFCSSRISCVESRLMLSSSIRCRYNKNWAISDSFISLPFFNMSWHSIRHGCSSGTYITTGVENSKKPVIAAIKLHSTYSPTPPHSKTPPSPVLASWQTSPPAPSMAASPRSARTSPTVRACSASPACAPDGCRLVRAD